MKKLLTISILTLLISNEGFAQFSSNENAWLGELKAGVRIQKAQKLYWENGFTIDITSPRILANRLHFGLSYVTSRFGSALNSNAIKQDNFLCNAGYHFRHLKQLQPFGRLNLGYFHADYESPIFDVLPNSTGLISIDAGLAYQFDIPLSLNLSLGYNLISGNGTTKPGSLYPVFYQLSLLHTIFK